MGLSFFLCAVHRNKVCIFHRGALTEQERVVYDHMRRSPYRSYLDEDAFQPEEAVYFKIIAERERTEALLRRLQPLLHTCSLRAVVRDEAGADGVSALYVYSNRATLRQAEARLMQLIRSRDPQLIACELLADRPYRSEHDAMVLISRLVRAYEPPRLLHKRVKCQNDKTDL